MKTSKHISAYLISIVCLITLSMAIGTIAYSNARAGEFDDENFDAIDYISAEQNDMTESTISSVANEKDNILEDTQNTEKTGDVEANDNEVAEQDLNNPEVVDNNKQSTTNNTNNNAALTDNPYFNNAQNDREVIDPTSIYVNALDSDTGNQIDGSVFEVSKLNESGEPVGDPEEIAGNDIYEISEDGQYKIVCTQAPEGYENIATEYTITFDKVFDWYIYDETGEFVSYYHLQYADESPSEAFETIDDQLYMNVAFSSTEMDISIILQWDDENGIDNLRDSYLIQLYDGDNLIEESEPISPEVSVYTFKNRYKKYRDGDKITYSIMQSTVPDGYSSSAYEKKVEIMENKEGFDVATIINKLNEVSLYINPARIEFYDEDSKTLVKIGGSEFTIIDTLGILEPVTQVIDADGSFYSIEQPGTFTIKQTKAPEGYKVNDKEFEITTKLYYLSSKVENENVIRTYNLELSHSGEEEFGTEEVEGKTITTLTLQNEPNEKSDNNPIIPVDTNNTLTTSYTGASADAVTTNTSDIVNLWILFTLAISVSTCATVFVICKKRKLFLFQR